MAFGKLWSVTVDCADPQQLAQFWVGLLDPTGHPFCVTMG
jgi:hypothetical protein